MDTIETRTTSQRLWIWLKNLQLSKVSILLNCGQVFSPQSLPSSVRSVAVSLVVFVVHGSVVIGTEYPTSDECKSLENG
jgi:uncharacterized membrane protein